MPCPEPPMGISSVGSFPVWSGGSLIFFQLFMCRNLALNRVVSYFLVAGMFLYLGVYTFLYFYNICTLPGVYTPPYAPYSSASLFSEALHVVGGCNGLPFV